MMRVTKEETRGAHRYYGQFYERSRVISMMFILKTGDPGEAVVCYDFVKEEWFNLDRASFDATLASGKLSEEREKHALWYLEQAQAFNGKGDDEAVEAFEYLSRTEGIIPAIESSHAIAYAMKLAPKMDKDKIIVVTVSGRGDKDCAAIARYRGEDIHE